MSGPMFPVLGFPPMVLACQAPKSTSYPGPANFPFPTSDSPVPWPTFFTTPDRVATITSIAHRADMCHDETWPIFTSLMITPLHSESLSFLNGHEWARSYERQLINGRPDITAF